jgi:hypothetical protein
MAGSNNPAIIHTQNTAYIRYTYNDCIQNPLAAFPVQRERERERERERDSNVAASLNYGV